MVEDHPIEGVLTNVIGSRNVAEAARAFGVGLVVMISTDKAVDPASVMGATKRLAEGFCQALDLHEARRAAAGDALRDGAVRQCARVDRLGRAAVPRQLAAGGPLTVTHPEVSRYFMTVREAVELVLAGFGRSGAGGDGGGRVRGKIFVLDMGEPVKIVDLARQMIRLAGLRPDKDIEIAYTGLRPGEKLHEALFHAGEAPIPTGNPGICWRRRAPPTTRCWRARSTSSKAPSAPIAPRDVAALAWCRNTGLIRPWFRPSPPATRRRPGRPRPP